MRRRREQYKKVCNLVSTLRKSKKLTQAELAKKIGVRQNFISKIESGERRLDVIETVLILKALGVDSRKFFERLVRDL